MFPEYKKLDLVKICSEINLFWREADVFEKSVTSKDPQKRFVFYEGPPSANGLPGIHHVMARLIKDIFCRYKTLSGFRVERKAGWDTHGLPVELSVEKNLNIKKDDIGKTISISDYNDACKKTVMKYTQSWNELTEMMGYWVDVEKPYVTYENKYIESVWFLLKRLFDKKLIYKGYTIQPYSPAAGTGLSSHELNQPGCYRIVKDLSVFALFRVLGECRLLKNRYPVFFVAWTTTPWTLFANTGLAVGKKIKYIFVETVNPNTLEKIVLICAEECLNNLFDKQTKKTLEKIGEAYEIVGSCLGADLVDLRYDQLLKYTQPVDSPKSAFRVISADFVNTGDGTGIVHLAPTFGADDFAAAKKNNLPAMLVLDKQKNKVPVVNLNGQFIDGLGEFSNRFVKPQFSQEKEQSVDIDIVVKLKKEGLAFRSEKHEHSYPHCWRTDKPILYYPLDSWFIKSTEYKNLMIEKNEEINWKPKSTGLGRFKNWLENLNDWNLSRSRFWGIPLPIWRSKDGLSVFCVGSVGELKDLCEKSVVAGNMKKNPLKDFNPKDMGAENYSLFDLHKNYVDNIVLSSEKGEPMYRENDVIDVWFDSGSMPYAQWHYPFENKNFIDSGEFFPANFIAEGVDQTRGWFFTLHAIAVMCFESVAFKNVISNGLVLDDLGQKMSKRLGNAVDPFDVLSSHGADSVRWYMITNSQPWDNLKFDINGVIEVKQKLFSTLYNIYSFFSLYANIDGFCFSEKEVNNRPTLDCWILSEINTLISNVDDAYHDYEPTVAGRLIQNFVIEKLSNWYVRLCRRRFWKGDYSLDKISAYQTLYHCLIIISKLSAPIAPFFMDKLFIDLNRTVNLEDCDSVHLSRFPLKNNNLINSVLEKKMKLTKEICSLALSLRKKEGIRVRQPLSSITICLDIGYNKSDVFVDLIRSEINVKSVFFSKNSSKIVSRKIIPNFSVLGKKYGSKIKKIITEIGKLNNDDINDFEKKNILNIIVDKEKICLSGAELIVKIDKMPGFLTAQTDGVLISLNTDISEELFFEGLARELVNFIQGERKRLGFSVMDKVSLGFSGNKKQLSTLFDHKEYIKQEVLAQKMYTLDSRPKSGSVFEFNDYKMYIAIDKF